MDRRCCVEAIMGILVRLVIEWFIMGMRFKAFPPEAIVINQGLVEFDAGSGMVKVTNKNATVRSYIYTSGLKVEYSDIYAVVKLVETGKDDGVQISSRIIFEDVNLGYERFYMWLMNLTKNEVSLNSINPRKVFILEIVMKMNWFSFWSVRFGSFEKVTIICPLQPEHINKPVGCVSRSS